MWTIRWKKPDSGEVLMAEEILNQEYEGTDIGTLEKIAQALRGPEPRGVHNTQEEVDGVIARYWATHPERRRMTGPPPD